MGEVDGANGVVILFEVGGVFREILLWSVYDLNFHMYILSDSDN